MTAAPEVDTAWYLHRYPDVAALGMDPVHHYTHHGRAERRLPHRIHALELETALWNGFSRSALPALHHLLTHAPSLERACACWVLARWHAAHNRWTHAHQALQGMADLPPMLDPMEHAILRLDVLQHIGNVTQAREEVQKAINHYGTRPDLCLAASALADSSAREDNAWPLWEHWLNMILQAAGLAPVAPIDATRPASLDNIGVREHLQQYSDHPRISVLVPARNAEPYIETALNSLLTQTWTNLEILVIDDASTDQTPQVVQRVATRDSRVRLICLPVNGGAYAARNAGLAQAQGAFITTHDSDDWSHPQRLAILAQELLTHPELRGVLGHWVRMDTSLQPHRWRVRERYLHPTVSTLIFRRECLERLGGWDQVRAGADSEYLERMRAVYGPSSVRYVLPDAPLVLARQLPSSLTNAPKTNLRTEHHGFRRIYRELYTHWHESQTPEELRIPPRADSRAFATPRIMITPDSAPATFHSILAADFSSDAETLRAALTRMLKVGQHVGILHWPHTSRAAKPLASWVLDQACAGLLDIVVPGEAVRANALLLLGAHILAQPMDNAPRILFQRARILTHRKIHANPEFLDDIPTFPGQHELNPERPTVLLCAHASGTELFGAEQSFLSTAQEFHALGFNVLVIIPDARNIAYVQKLQRFCHQIFSLPLRHWKADVPPSTETIDRLARMTRHWNVKAVHANTIMIHEPLLAAKKCGIPAVMHVREIPRHDPDLCKVIGLSPDEIHARIPQVADAIIANSRFTASEYNLPDKTFVVPNTVDLDTLDIPNAINPNCITIGLISSNIPKKGVRHMITLARKLADTTPQARFIIIGPCTEHARQLQNEMRKNPLPNLSFGGYATTPANAIGQINVVLNLSTFTESFGRTILEAMAARRPVIVYNKGALPELIEDGVQGFVLPDRDLEKIAQKIHFLCLNPDAIINLGEAGRKRASSFFHTHVAVKKLQTAYTHILKKSYDTGEVLDSNSQRTL